MSNILKVKNLNCRRSGEEVLQGVSFTLEAGKNLEIIGSNGSGKTTVLRSLLGFVNDHDGGVYWNDSEVPSTFQEGDVSCFYQGHQIAVKPLLTTYENLKFSSSGFNSSLEEITLIAEKNWFKEFFKQARFKSLSRTKKTHSYRKMVIKGF